MTKLACLLFNYIGIMPGEFIVSPRRRATSSEAWLWLVYPRYTVYCARGRTKKPRASPLQSTVYVKSAGEKAAFNVTRVPDRIKKQGKRDTYTRWERMNRCAAVCRGCSSLLPAKYT